MKLFISPFLIICFFIAIYISEVSTESQIGDSCSLNGVVAIGKITVNKNCHFFKKKEKEINAASSSRRDISKNMANLTNLYRIDKPKNLKVSPPWYCCPIRKSEMFCDSITTNKFLKTSPISRHKRITYGKNANLGEFPFFAALAKINEKRKLDFDCGGALISPRFILTAAHCFRNVEKPLILARLGTVDLHSSQSVDYDIIRRHKHDEYNPDESRYHDIGLVELKIDVQFTFVIQPACLVTPEIYQNLRPASVFHIAGFGLTEKGSPSDVLMKAEIFHVPPIKCENFYRDKNLPIFHYYTRGIDNTTDILCAQDTKNKMVNTCPGDSGGGLIYKHEHVNYVVGVTSTGYDCKYNLPGFYSSVLKHLDWIEGIVWK